MRSPALITLSLVALSLAACDAPDPAAFHHNLRSDVMVGTHINGNVGAGEVTNNSDVHSVEQLERNTANTVVSGAGAAAGIASR